ncbi:oligosaccharyltransferase complex subunit ostc [Anaeramoeba flamelloides]|uniref:Oligosaccharyltransferase complex subunit ostc n=1 Tax=Anaeramoeba flamelloides TaxID=1746091 RepID=A0AAV7Y202_9EUKA|nr:oligosaccharyltransferase complex subunit ostc [Anaeramoeba flamelloides]
MSKKLNFLESSFCKVLRPPQLNLRIIKPSSMAVFAFVLFALFIVFAGVIYDLIVEPPSIGVEYGIFNSLNFFVFIIFNFIFNQNFSLLIFSNYIKKMFLTKTNNSQIGLEMKGLLQY